MREKIPEVGERTRITCDVCGVDCSPQPGDFWPKQCAKCKKDLCRYKCTVWDPREHGDYPDAYCKHCWDIGEPFRQQQMQLEEEHDERMEAVEQAWNKACEVPPLA